MIIDSHAHYDDEQFDEDRKQVLEKIQKQGVVRVVNPASNLDSAVKCLRLSEEYSFLYTAVGIHPHNALECSSEALRKLRDLAGCNKVVAIGEVGLDYHYDFSPVQVQKDCLSPSNSTCAGVKASSYTS